MHCHVVCIVVLQPCSSNFMELHIHTCMEHYVVWPLAVVGDGDACTYDRVLVES